MTAWVVIALVTSVALAAVLVALFSTRAEQPPAPAREVLPTPDEAVAPRFTTRWPGYDPAEVDAHLGWLSRAYAALYHQTGPEARSHARVELGAGPDLDVVLGHLPGPISGPDHLPGATPAPDRPPDRPPGRPRGDDDAG